VAGYRTSANEALWRNHRDVVAPPQAMHQEGGDGMSDELTQKRPRPSRAKATGSDVTDSKAKPPSALVPAQARSAMSPISGDVEATTVSIVQGGANTVHATSVDVRQGGISRAEAQDIAVSFGGIALARGQRVSTEFGANVLTIASESRVTQSFASTVIARDATLDQSLVQTVIAGRVTLRQPTGVLFLIAGRVEGTVRPIFDWRGALAAGAAMGVVLGMLRRRR